MNEIIIDNKLQTQIEAAVAKSNELIIDTEEKLAQAADITKFIKEKGKQVEKARKELVDPLNAHVKNINARFKHLSEPLEKAEGILKGKMLTFQRELEAQQRAIEEAKRKELEEFTRKAAEDARATGDIETAKEIDKATNLMVNKPIELDKVRGGATGALSSITKRWKAEVLDIQALAAARPDLVLPNMMLINKLIHAGVRNIEGVEIKQEESISIR